MTSYVEMQLPELPLGYKYTGEYAVPCDKDFYLGRNSGVVRWSGPCPALSQYYPLIEKVKWVPRHGERVWYISITLSKVDHCPYNERGAWGKQDKEALLFRTANAAQLALDLMLAAISGVSFNDEDD